MKKNLLCLTIVFSLVIVSSDAMKRRLSETNVQSCNGNAAMNIDTQDTLSDRMQSLKRSLVLAITKGNLRAIKYLCEHEQAIQSLTFDEIDELVRIAPTESIRCTIDDLYSTLLTHRFLSLHV